MDRIVGRPVSGLPAIAITVEEGVISSVEALPVEGDDLAARTALPYVAPAFVDIQVNGYQGHDYCAPDLQVGTVAAVIGALAESGTTRHLPTIVTNPPDLICRNLRTIADAIDSSAAVEAAIPGVHIEGPYISAEEGPRGAHDPRYVRDPDLHEYREWQDAAGGRVRMITLAPEKPGALPFIERLRADGVIAAIGHTAASPEQIRDAVSAGATFSTHIGNGSHAMLPRFHNYLWEQLAADELSAGLIADGYHLPPAVMKSIVRTKGLDRLVLVSDVAVLGGSSPGLYKWGGIDVQVFPDGHLGLAGTEFFAGAGHLLDRGVAQLISATGVSLEDAVMLCTVNPSRFLGGPIPAIEEGARADLVLFDFNPGDDSLRVTRTYAAVQLIYAEKETEVAAQQC